MERISMIINISAIVVVCGAFTVCAAALILEKARRLSLWKLPKLRIAVLAGGAVVATFAGQKGDPDPQGGDTPGNLVLHCTFDSESAVTTPAVGYGGTCSGATFEEGKKGSAMRVPANAASAVARLPLSDGLPAARGCIEFWAKIDGGSATYSGGGGSPDFLRASTTDNDSTFLSVAFTANDGLGKSGLGCGYGFYGFHMFPDAYYGSKSYSDYLTQDAVFDWHHYALVWNVDGIASLSGSPRAAVILDGTVRVSTNGNDGWNRDEFLEAMDQSVYLSFGHSGSHTAYLIDELKVWNEDRTKFEEPPASLVLHCTFDSESAVTMPAIGDGGTCSDAIFVEGKVGSALSLPTGTRVASLSLPNGLPAEMGCIEFWAKIADGNDYYGDSGHPDFFWTARSGDEGAAFLRFTANNGNGGGGLYGGISPFLLLPTQSFLDSNRYSKYLGDDIFGWHHYAVVWNVNGIAAIDGNPRVAIMLDGSVQGKSNGSNDWNKNDFVAAVSEPLTIYFSKGDHNRRAYSIDEFKIWNCDKTTFPEPDEQKFVYYKDAVAVYDGQEHTLAAPSGASGDETFLYSLAKEGPFVAEMPTLTNAGSLRIWYKETIGGESIVASAAVTVQKRPLTFTSASATKPYDGTPLAANTVAVTGTPADGEGFSFSVTGSQTVYGESDNMFTWTANDGTDPDNYDISEVFGKLSVTMEQAGEVVGYEVVEGSGGQTIRITQLSYPDGGDVTLPVVAGGLPVSEIAAGALSGAAVSSVRVPAGVSVAGEIFENQGDVTNVTFEADADVSGALSFRGCGALREVVAPNSALVLNPWTFLGCWNLERVVFSGEPPFGDDAPQGSDETALLTASARPASLLQMADMICYPVARAAKWEKALGNLGYGGRYGAYEGEWAGEVSLVADSGNLNPAAHATLVVSNVIVSVITNVLVPAVPAEQPEAHYAARTGDESGTVLAGAAGWDAFGLPEGMTWDRATGTLGGVPVRSGTYDVMLVSGSGADTKLMRTTVDVAGYAVTTGYVGVAFKVSGAPWDALASYKNPPAGLAWKSKVLSGVPTKAGTYTFNTKDGEPVRIAILALPDGAKGKFNGILVDGAGKRYPLTFSATAAGKLSATVVKGTKTHSLSAAKWSSASVETVNGVPHRTFSATLTASGLSLSVKVDADVAWNADALTAVGTLGAVKNLAGTAKRNAFADSDEAKAAAAGLAGTYSLAAVSDGAGGWTLTLPEEGAKGALTVVLKATGAATLSGTLPDKKKVSASATLDVDEGMAPSLGFYVKGVWIVWSPALD